MEKFLGELIRTVTLLSDEVDVLKVEVEKLKRRTQIVEAHVVDEDGHCTPATYLGEYTDGTADFVVLSGDGILFVRGLKQQVENVKVPSAPSTWHWHIRTFADGPEGAARHLRVVEPEEVPEVKP